MAHALRIDQYQQDQRNHALFPARMVARGWGHAGYMWAGLTDDGEMLCCRCIRDEYAQIARSTVRHYRDGWGVVGIVNASELEDRDHCAHCGRELH